MTTGQPIQSMPEPVVEMIDDKYEIYRIVSDYEALVEAFRDRVEDLDTTHKQIDFAGNMLGGYSSKILSNPPIKTLGKVSMGKMLKATGMMLVLVIDDERFAPVKAMMEKRRRPLRKPAIAGSIRPSWLFTAEKAREMGSKRFSTMTEAQRKRHQRKAGKASAAARRRKRKERERTTQPEGV